LDGAPSSTRCYDAINTKVTIMGGRRTRADNIFRIAAGESGNPAAGSLRAQDAKFLPSDLPLHLTSFIGRERELAELKETLNATRLLTIIGPGGSGKTRLALRVAEDLAEGFEDGARSVELAALTDSDLVPQRVASALGVRELPGRRVTELLVEHLSPKEVLLVLDNCEHLIEGCARLVDALLRACARLRLVATSREPLGVAGEIAWPVPPLSLPDVLKPGRERAIGDLLLCESVRLFVERAASARPGFALTVENASAVGRICERLDGMPLAIELAASRVRALSPRQILDRLDDRFRILTGGRASVQRHRTLKATMDWSYELLSEKEKALFRRLSVFAGGWALEAAEAVCAGGGIPQDEVLDLLCRLVDQSLVVVWEWGGEARYRLLETVRQYGKEKLEDSGEDEEVGRRHSGFFLELAEIAETALLGPKQETWVERLEVEHDNLRAALDWSEREPIATEAGLRLAGALQRFWTIRGHFTEGQARLQTLLTLPGASARSAARARACYALGMLYYRRGNYAAGDLKKARASFEESLEIFRRLEDEEQIAASLAELGNIHTEFGEYDTARASFEESLMLQRRSGDERGIARTLNGLGWLNFLRGEHAAARPLLEESLAILRKLGDKFYLGACVLYLGCLDCEQGDYAAGRSRFEGLTRLVSFQQYRYVAPLVLEAFVVLAAAQGQAARALRLAGAAGELRQIMGWQFRLSWQRYVDHWLEPVWQALDEEAGAVARAEGGKMTLDQALAYALLEEETTIPLRQQAQGLPDGPSLSARELEVLELVGEGLTDVGVAERLHLSPRTVGRHLENVYRKLGVSSRTAAVRTAGELGLL
jgi:predicted ATPase/DNA-binding CsgD family transcriptional regulator